MKIKQSIEDRYFALLEGYAGAQTQDVNAEATQLGRELARGGLSPEELLQLHHEATEWLEVTNAEETPEASWLSAALVDLLTGYSLALHGQLEEAAPALEDRFTQAVHSGPLVMMISRIRDDLIIDANDRFLKVFGYQREEVIGRTTIELNLLEGSALRERTTRALQEEGRATDFEAKMRTKSGEIRTLLTTIETTEFNGEPCFLRMGYDITERRRSQEKLLADAFHDAFHDVLTGLPNRALFLDRLGRSVERSKRHPDYSFAILFLDIDHLKAINDSFGHMVGDQLLTAVAVCLKERLTPRDTVARLGGDEFAILIEDAEDASVTLAFAEELQEALSKPFDLSGNQVSTSVSIGIAISDPNYAGPEQVLRDADRAMYRARARGRGRHEVFDRDTHARASARLKLKTDMLKTFERRGFYIHYQPIIALDTGTITSFEALGRWRHPDRGMVSPVEFIPMAEETGLIIDIGRWMVREACEQVQAWQNQFACDPPLGVSVNLCSKEFRQPDLIKLLEQILNQTGLEPARLHLEIREGVIMEDPQAGSQVLADLRSLGVQVYIDDFGTGHSSLSFMYQFPIDALKIAPSFIHRIRPDGENTEVVRTIVMLARDFGMQAIAEGVETANQLAHLRKLKCRYGQGFYFAKPGDSASAVRLLAEDPRW